MMRVLFLSQVLPFPLDAGPKVRSYYVLRQLAQNHSVTLVAFTRANDSRDAIAHLESYCQRVHSVPLTRSRARDALSLATSFVQARPFLIVRDDLRAMSQAVAARVKEDTFDVVHADQLAMAHYALRVPRVKRVLDQHNAVWTIARRLAANEKSALKKIALAREARLLQTYEARVCAQFDAVVTVTEEDKRALTDAAYPPRAPLRTIPICIDPDDRPALPFQTRARDIVFVGGMFYPPNVDAALWCAREVLPSIWRESPETRLYIVGARPAAELLALSQRDPRIVVTGYAPDTNSFFARAAAFVVPLRAGGGMRVKILDAWARGVPIVSTTIGAEGIEYTRGENILIADTPAEFARAIVKLIRERDFARRVAEQGRAWVKSHYDWRTVYRAWDALYPPQG